MLFALSGSPLRIPRFFMTKIKKKCYYRKKTEEDQYLISPLTGEKIPAAKAAEHMKVSTEIKKKVAKTSYEFGLVTMIQCSGSKVLARARIRIRNYLYGYGSGSFHHN
jgi:hypothetical protein